MGRVLKKEEPVKKIFYRDFVDSVRHSTNIEDAGYDNSVWKEKPVDILSFCLLYLREPLFEPVQSKFGRKMAGSRPGKFSTRFIEGHAFWGKGCVSGDTILKDEKTNIEYTIKELAENKKSIFIKSVDIVKNKFTRYRKVICKTGIPFLKGNTELFEIETESGKKIKVSGEHKFLTNNGWKKLKDLYVGDKIMIEKQLDEFISSLQEKNRRFSSDGSTIIMFVFDEIKSIKSIGKQEFYDINVPKTNCYFSQGILNHNSGKDRTIAKIILYYAYLLVLLKNPQKYLREEYGCAIADDESIDLANMSINARQAMNVFFKKLKYLTKKCKDPKTGKNFFANHGCDLRDGQDIQKTEIKFSEFIYAYSLNSETNTGEGLNLMIVAVDELGTFPADKAFLLLDSIRETITSRFKRVGKLMILSYMYYDNDPMDVLFRTYEDDEDIYSSKSASYIVNPLIKKSDLAKYYLKNPERAMRTYECQAGKGKAGGYVSLKYMLSYMFDPNYENPIKGDLISIISDYLLGLEFKKWFRGSDGKVYAVRVDLATGKVDQKRDCAGFSLCHIEPMKPKINEKMKADLAKQGIFFNYGENDDVIRKGVVHDLVFQLVAKSGSEIQIADVRKFIIMLKKVYNFNIIYVTYDGWESRESIQLLNSEGIQAESFSVDKDTKAYETWKELTYQQLVKSPPNSIAKREAEELVVNDKGKIDHPVLSWERLKTEGTDSGSKDVMDAVAGNTYIAFDKIPLAADIFFG